jgi:PAS domain S-box-containing protein
MTVHGQAPLNLEELPCACLRTSKEGLIIFANGYFLENYGWDFNALKAAGMEALFSNASLVFFDSYLYPIALAETTCVEVKLTVFTGDKQHKAVIVSVRQLPDGGFAWVLMEAEKRASLFEELSDAKDALIDQSTELDNLNRKLEQTSAEMSAILDNALDGIITIDIEGLITSFNNAAQELFGYSADQVVGQHVFILLSTQNFNRQLRYITAVLNSRMPSMVGKLTEVEARRADGGVFPAELAVSSSIGKNGISFIGIVRDLTERQKLDNSKAEFISTVSHELRTPLTSIKGVLGLIRGGVFDKFPEKLHSVVNIAYANCGRLELLINSILEIEQISAGKKSYKMVPINLALLVEEAVVTSMGYGVEYGVTFIYSDTDEPLTVNADKDRLIQVMANLLSNAAKFSLTDGKVEVSVGRHNESARIIVKDYGSGIPEKAMPTIFDRFTQADSSDRRAKGGTGLGLNIAKTIVDAHDGSISFTSELGKGTTFYVDLPVVEAESVQQTNEMEK